MIVALSIWPMLTVFLAMVALYAVWSRRDEPARGMTVALFLAASAFSYFALQAPIGYPDHDRVPPGEWTVLGARIDVDVAIYAMLDNGTGEPHLYRLPYTAGQADKLQQAIDATAANAAGGVEAQADAEGEIEFHPKPVEANPEKTPETPVVGTF